MKMEGSIGPSLVPQKSLVFFNMFHSLFSLVSVQPSAPTHSFHRGGLPLPGPNAPLDPAALYAAIRHGHAGAVDAMLRAHPLAEWLSEPATKRRGSGPRASHHQRMPQKHNPEGKP